MEDLKAGEELAESSNPPTIEQHLGTHGLDRPRPSAHMNIIHMSRYPCGQASRRPLPPITEHAYRTWAGSAHCRPAAHKSPPTQRAASTTILPAALEAIGPIQPNQPATAVAATSADAAPPFPPSTPYPPITAHACRTGPHSAHTQAVHGSPPTQRATPERNPRPRGIDLPLGVGKPVSGATAPPAGGPCPPAKRPAPAPWTWPAAAGGWRQR
jgi:hypothetical protein